MSSMKKAIALLEENNRILKEIRTLLFTCAYDNDYLSKQDMRSFAINVAANIFIELLEGDKEFKETIKNNLKNI